MYIEGSMKEYKLQTKKGKIKWFRDLENSIYKEGKGLGFG